MTYIMDSDVNGYCAKADRDVLLWRISTPQKSNILNDDPIFPDEIDPTSAKFVEGSITSIFVNKHERNKEARRQCLDAHGTACAVCEKKMSDIYGEIFSGKIHVHHLTPMNKYSEAHDVNPIEDLRPVCPNCHMIIHCREGALYTIEEVRAFIKNA